MVSIEATLVDQLHKLAPVASGTFPDVAVNPHTVTIQRANNSVDKRFCSRVANTTCSPTNSSLEPRHALHDHSLI